MEREKENFAILNRTGEDSPTPSKRLLGGGESDLLGGRPRLQLADLEIDWANCLGEGAFGSVYAACGPGHPPLAVKVVRTSGLSAKATTQLRAEVTLHACVQHEAIVPLLGAFDARNLTYLVMPACAADVGSLLALSDDLAPLAAACPALLGQLLAAVAHLHDTHSVVHSDLKPANLLLAETGKLKLCDLGAAARVSERGRDTLVGTHAYHAPERVAIDHLGLLGAAYSFPSDVWACGCLLVELATGALPFPAVARDPLAQPESICFRPPRLDGLASAGRSLAAALLSKHAYARPTAEEARAHEYVAAPEQNGAESSALLRACLDRHLAHSRPLRVPPHTPARAVASSCGRPRESAGRDDGGRSASMGSAASSRASSLPSWASSLVGDETPPCVAALSLGDE